MKEYVLLLPILFIFHDMEEIIGFGWFFRNNKQLLERFSKITAAYKGFTTEGFALAVYEEFIPFFGISLLAYYFPGDVLNALWFGLLLALILFGKHRSTKRLFGMALVPGIFNIGEMMVFGFPSLNSSAQSFNRPVKR